MCDTFLEKFAKLINIPSIVSLTPYEFYKQISEQKRADWGSWNTGNPKENNPEPNEKEFLPE